MISYFDKSSLQKLLKDFYTVVGIRISVFDDEFRLVTEYPVAAPAFCADIRKNKIGENACRDCDREAFLRAKKLREPHIYTCHAGITEAITPIKAGGGVVGYVILAHMLPTEGYEEAKITACCLAEKYGVPKDRSMVSVSEITRRTKEQINSALSLLDAIASYVYIKDLALWRDEEVSASMDAYIKNNLSEKLTSEIICRRFNFSRTRLYQISMQAFGMGITKYIEYCRMEKAKKMLLEGRTITEVTSSCGYNEYNYFCKVFKKNTGVSPSEYKKKRQN